MNSLSIFGKKLAAPVAVALAMQFNALAQNPVESTHIDEKYAYTTVVYKHKAADDKEVLSALESEFSIGDVVRVTLAPPPSLTAITASEPVYADKSKGEDTWVKSNVRASDNLSASADLAVRSNLNTKAIAPAPKAVSVKKPAAPVPAPPVASVEKPVASVAVEPAAVPDMASHKQLRSTEKSTKAHKTAKKAGKKSSSKKVKFKQRKKGKQRYACPTF